MASRGTGSVRARRNIHAAWAGAEGGVESRRTEDGENGGGRSAGPGRYPALTVPIMRGTATASWVRAPSGPTWT